MQKIFLILSALMFFPGVAQANNVHQHDNLNERLVRIERAVSSREAVNILARLQKLEQENAELLGRIEELQFELRRLGKKQSVFFEEVEKLVKSNPSSTKTSSRLASIPNQQSTIDPHALYNQHIQSLREGRLQEAKDGFLVYLRDYPQGKFAANAHYWLGELFLKEGYLKSALDHFNAVLLNHPDSHKTPDAWYKKGITLFKVNRFDEGKSTLQKLIHEHPQSGAARLAQLYLERRE